MKTGTLQIGAIAEIRMGVTLRGRDATRPVSSGSCRLVRIGDVSQDGTWLSAEFAQIEPNEAVRDELFLRAGDVLFPNRGTRTTAIAFDLDKPRTLAGAQFFVLRPDVGRVLPAYLAWFLRTDASARHFDARRKGTYVQVIQRHDLAELELPLPSLDGQRKIAELARMGVVERELCERIARLSYRYLNAQLAEAASAAVAGTRDGGG